VALTQFIKDLLYTNEKLIIPGFGGFIAQHTPAQINKDKKLLLPPQRHFTFDVTLNGDDDKFAQYIGRLNSVALPEAKQLVKEMVDEFHRKLKDGNTLYIEEVGYFIQDENGEIHFKIDEENNNHPECYGLMPINYVEPIPEPEEEIIDEDYYPVTKKSPVTKIIVIFLIINAIGALAAIVYWKFDYIKSQFRGSDKIVTTTPAEKKDIPAALPDTTELGKTIDTTTQMKNALNYQETPKEDSIIKKEVSQPKQINPPVVNQPKKLDTSSEAKFYIIAGSFQTFEKAEILNKELKRLGFQPEIIEFSQNLFRISIGEFSTKEEAKTQLEILKNKKGAEGAWLLRK
jgi:nucleoid DNA-binding protein